MTSIMVDAYVNVRQLNFLSNNITFVLLTYLFSSNTQQLNQQCEYSNGQPFKNW